MKCNHPGCPVACVVCGAKDCGGTGRWACHSGTETEPVCRGPCWVQYEAGKERVKRERRALIGYVHALERGGDPCDVVDGIESLVRAIVSPRGVFHREQVNDRDESAMPTERELLLGQTLRRVLVRAGVIRADAIGTGPELVAAAERYIEHSNQQAEDAGPEESQFRHWDPTTATWLPLVPASRLTTLRAEMSEANRSVVKNFATMEDVATMLFMQHRCSGKCEACVAYFARPIQSVGETYDGEKEDGHGESVGSGTA